MCRSIRTLHNFAPPATDEEVRAAARQYVRKVSGFTEPSQRNSALFDQAIAEITAVTRRLVDELVTPAPARSREAEAAKARVRWKQRAERMKGETAR
jgi:hypothetical protein